MRQKILDFILSKPKLVLFISAVLIFSTLALLILLFSLFDTLGWVTWILIFATMALGIGALAIIYRERELRYLSAELDIPEEELRDKYFPTLKARLARLKEKKQDTAKRR